MEIRLDALELYSSLWRDEPFYLSSFERSSEATHCVSWEPALLQTQAPSADSEGNCGNLLAPHNRIKAVGAKNFSIDCALCGSIACLSDGEMSDSSFCSTRFGAASVGNRARNLGCRYKYSQIKDAEITRIQILESW